MPSTAISEKSRFGRQSRFQFRLSTLLLFVLLLGIVCSLNLTPVCHADGDSERPFWSVKTYGWPDTYLTVHHVECFEHREEWHGPGLLWNAGIGLAFLIGAFLLTEGLSRSSAPFACAGQSQDLD